MSISDWNYADGPLDVYPNPERYVFPARGWGGLEPGEGFVEALPGGDVYISWPCGIWFRRSPEFVREMVCALDARPDEWQMFPADDNAGAYAWLRLEKGGGG